MKSVAIETCLDACDVFSASLDRQIGDLRESAARGVGQLRAHMIELLGEQADRSIDRWRNGNDPPTQALSPSQLQAEGAGLLGHHRSRCRQYDGMRLERGSPSLSTPVPALNVHHHWSSSGSDTSEGSGEAWGVAVAVSSSQASQAAPSDILGFSVLWIHLHTCCSVLEILRWCVQVFCVREGFLDYTRRHEHTVVSLVLVHTLSICCNILSVRAFRADITKAMFATVRISKGCDGAPFVIWRWGRCAVPLATACVAQHVLVLTYVGVNNLPIFLSPLGHTSTFLCLLLHMSCTLSLVGTNALFGIKLFIGWQLCNLRIANVVELAKAGIDGTSGWIQIAAEVWSLDLDMARYWSSTAMGGFWASFLVSTSVGIAFCMVMFVLEPAYASSRVYVAVQMLFVQFVCLFIIALTALAKLTTQASSMFTLTPSVSNAVRLCSLQTMGYRGDMHASWPMDHLLRCLLLKLDMGVELCGVVLINYRLVLKVVSNFGVQLPLAMGIIRMLVWGGDPAVASQP
mmetsp:Transcript_59387/g.165841  ORF Transcript_59387/g.165841 Transcript_59387/m.165841 type:complete len:516 (+) Transcript_59387:179-1726(+)